MLRIAAHVGPSPIAGIGLFAGEAVPAGTVVWRHDPGIDATFDPARGIEPRLQALLDEHGWFNEQDGRWYLAADNMRFMNHAVEPNTCERDRFTVVAARDIAAGEELTCDYQATCDAFRRSPPDWGTRK